MKRLSTIIGIATILIIVGGIFAFSRQPSNENLPPNPTRYEYFWGQGCPHCAKVEDFLSNWENRDKIEIDEKEVYNNRANAQLMSQRAKACGLAPNQVGVPFLVTPEGECITGDTPVINFFENMSFE